jgi:hypothetical protein
MMNRMSLQFKDSSFMNLFEYLLTFSLVALAVMRKSHPEPQKQAYKPSSSHRLHAIS